MSKKNNNGGFFSAISFFIIMFMFSTFMFSKGKNEDTSNDIKTYDFSSISYDDLDKNAIDTMSKILNVETNTDNADEIYLFNSVFNNKNLNQEEKNLFYGYYSVVNDIVNIDKNSAYDALSKVSVNYVDRDENISENILGDYDHRTNKINIYTSDDKDNYVLLHEGIHCLFNNYKTACLPRAFTEGMTELITNEYFSKDPFYEDNTYPLEISYVKMLCELVGTERVLNAYVTGDYSLIYREMDKYNSAETSSYKILDIYEDAYNHIDELGNSKYTSEDRKNAYNLIEKIYNKKQDKSNNKEFKYLHELSASGFEENATEFFSQYTFYYGVLEKAYISNDLKEKFPVSSNVNLYERHQNILKKSK